MYGRDKIYEYQFGASQLNVEPFEKLRDFKMNELSQMISYCESKKCRMDFLCSYLGDNSVEKCNNCSNCLHRSPYYVPDRFWQNKVKEFYENFYPELEVESSSSNIVNGIAASYYGFSNVGAIIHRCKYENGGDFPNHLLILTLRAFRHKFGSEKFDMVVFVPPTESGDLVRNFASKIARTLKFPFSYKLKKIHNTKPQKIFQNYVLKRDNVKDVFYYENEAEIVGKRILLIDDIFDSGATIKEIAKMFTKLGAEEIAPLVIAKTISGDI